MCTSKALVFLVFALIDVTRDNNKANYLAGMLSSLVFASVLPMLGGGLHLAFPNNVRAGALQVTAGGVVYLQALLASVHRGMQSSWGQAWESMFAAGLLSSSWQAELRLPFFGASVTLPPFPGEQQTTMGANVTVAAWPTCGHDGHIYFHLSGGISCTCPYVSSGCLCSSCTCSTFPDFWSEVV